MIRTDPTLTRHILLATDLSARCDRAQDRALTLARAWKAKLTVLHVVDVLYVPNDNTDRRETISRAKGSAFNQLRELKDISDVACDIEIREGQPTDTVLEVAKEKNCDLIVTGVAGNTPLGQVLLGSTTSSLVRRAEVPVLVVKKRGREAYRGAVVASDLSEASGRALEMAAQIFSPSQLTLFHVFDMPFRGFVDDKRAYEQERSATVRNEARAFIAGLLKNAAAEVGIRVAYGNPAHLLAEHVEKENVDLVITGTHGRTGILSVMLGSVAAAILDDVPCDVMVVPSRGARTAP